MSISTVKRTVGHFEPADFTRFLHGDEKSNESISSVPSYGAERSFFIADDKLKEQEKKGGDGKPVEQKKEPSPPRQKDKWRKKAPRTMVA